MKRVGLFVMALFILAARPQNNERISIENAIKNGLIQVEATSLGGHSGEVIDVAVIPLAKKPFILFIPAGTHFIPDDEGDQNIFVVNDQEEMIASSTRRIKVEGFCSESSDRSPSTGSGFKIIHSEEQKLIKLAEYMRSKNFSTDVKQSAVWAVSDHKPISHIYQEGNQEQVNELRKFISTLTGQPNVWYSTERNIEILADRTIAATPVKVSGDIDYHVTRPGKMNAAVYKEDGTKLFKLGEGMQLPRSGDYSFFFNLTVKGWKNGTYEVKVFIDEEPIHVQAFEV
ncbi:hypothetical protein N9Y29_00605 [Crocinitomicaceae bacterium]|nr:hypothetical protein [Crocinitomicaceae bacterium]